MIRQRLRNSNFFNFIFSVYKSYFYIKRRKFGYIHPSAYVRMPSIIRGIGNVYLYEGTHLYSNTLILSTRAKFIMKKNSGAAEGLTVVTGNHYSEVGRFFMNVTDADKPEDYDKDVVIEEDVWISCNVTILAGVIIGRGSVIGAGTVVRRSIPPYALVIGNPSKIVGFKFTPEEIIEHEKKLYSEDKRLPFELLSRNYQKLYIERINEIKNYLKQ